MTSLSFTAASRISAAYDEGFVCCSIDHDLSDSAASSLLQILVHHIPTNRMIKILILLKRLQCQFAVNLIQLPIHRSPELHPSNLAQQLCRRLINRLVLGGQTDAEVTEGELDVAGCAEGVGFAHCLGLASCQGGLEALDG